MKTWMMEPLNPSITKPKNDDMLAKASQDPILAQTYKST